MRIEAQAQRIAIVIADRALGLPGRERPERQQLGDDGRRRLAARPRRATSTVAPTVRPCSRSSRALNDSQRLPVASIASTGWPARTFSPTSATITLTTPSAGARRMVLSSRRSSTASADAAALTCASAMARSSRVGPATAAAWLASASATSARAARHVVFGLIERLLRGDVAARQVGGAGELRLRIVQPRFRLGDLGRQRGDLLRAHAGIDVVAVGGRGGKRRARLRHRRGQLERGQLGDDVAGAHAGALLDLDGGELAADLGRHADLGRAHDADDGRGRLRAPQQISAGACRDEQQAERDDACDLRLAMRAASA